MRHKTPAYMAVPNLPDPTEVLTQIAGLLERIAVALEEGNKQLPEHSSPEYMERVLSNQERALANTERELNIREAHNLWHKQQGPHEGTPTA